MANETKEECQICGGHEECDHCSQCGHAVCLETCAIAVGLRTYCVRHAPAVLEAKAKRIGNALGAWMDLSSTLAGHEGVLAALIHELPEDHHVRTMLAGQMSQLAAARSAARQKAFA